MNKNEFVTAISEKSGFTKKDSGEMLDAIIEVVTESLAEGQEISILGFGKFSVSHRAATTGKNPQTGEPIKIAARNQAKFKPGKGLKDAINA